MDLVIEMANKIKFLQMDLDSANYRNEKLNEERVKLEANIQMLNDTVDSCNKELAFYEEENKTLKLKLDDLNKEF